MNFPHENSTPIFDESCLPRIENSTSLTKLPSTPNVLFMITSNSKMPQNEPSKYTDLADTTNEISLSPLSRPSINVNQRSDCAHSTGKINAEKTVENYPAHTPRSTAISLSNIKKRKAFTPYIEVSRKTLNFVDNTSDSVISTQKNFNSKLENLHVYKKNDMHSEKENLGHELKEEILNGKNVKYNDTSSVADDKIIIQNSGEKMLENCKLLNEKKDAESAPIYTKAPNVTARGDHNVERTIVNQNDLSKNFETHPCALSTPKAIDKNIRIKNTTPSIRHATPNSKAVKPTLKSSIPISKRVFTPLREISGTIENSKIIKPHFSPEKKIIGTHLSTQLLLNQLESFRTTAKPQKQESKRSADQSAKPIESELAQRFKYRKTGNTPISSRKLHSATTPKQICTPKKVTFGPPVIFEYNICSFPLKLFDLNCLHRLPLPPVEE